MLLLFLCFFLADIDPALAVRDFEQLCAAQPDGGVAASAGGVDGIEPPQGDIGVDFDCGVLDREGADAADCMPGKGEIMLLF